MASSPLILDFLPVGFRFRPTNEELVNHYLKNKLLDNVSHVNNVIEEVDVCRFEPWELPSRSIIKSHDPEWFFLCPCDYKYAKSKKFNRATELGFWKATGIEHDIKIHGTDKVIATKKILVFYLKATGNKCPVRTNWVIHEYHDAVTFDDTRQRTHVLCHLIKNAEKKGEDENYTMVCDEGESSRQMTTSFPPTIDFVLGLRFCPTDEELIKYYLKNKILGNDSIVNNVIAEVDVCKYEPWDLPARSVIKSDDQEWFFLCPIEYKYAKSKRLKRTTNNGFWKATGKDRSIMIRGTNKIIGTKKTLVYHEDPVPGVKTNWIIHEYHDAIFDDHQRTFVLCRLMKKAEKNTEEELDTMICDVGESSRHMSSDYENQETLEGISNVSSRTLPKIRMESIFEEPYQADKYFPFSTQQSSIYENEPEVYFSNSQFQGDYFRNEDMVIQSPFETNEEENNFINSMIVDGAPTRQGKCLFEKFQTYEI